MPELKITNMIFIQLQLISLNTDVEVVEIVDNSIISIALREYALVCELNNNTVHIAYAIVIFTSIKKKYQGDFYFYDYKNLLMLAEAIKEDKNNLFRNYFFDTFLKVRDEITKSDIKNYIKFISVFILSKFVNYDYLELTGQNFEFFAFMEYPKVKLPNKTKVEEVSL